MKRSLFTIAALSLCASASAGEIFSWVFDDNGGIPGAPFNKFIPWQAEVDDAHWLLAQTSATPVVYTAPFDFRPFIGTRGPFDPYDPAATYTVFRDTFSLTAGYSCGTFCNQIFISGDHWLAGADGLSVDGGRGHWVHVPTPPTAALIGVSLLGLLMTLRRARPDERARPV